MPAVPTTLPTPRTTADPGPVELLHAASTEAQATARAAAAAVELTERSLAATSPEEASRRIAEAVRDHLSAAVVAILQTGGAAPVVSTAGESQLSEPVPSLLADALHETLLRCEPTEWPAPSDRKRHGLCVHHRIAEAAGWSLILSAPLRDVDGNTIGVWLIAWKDTVADVAGARRFLAAGSRPVATTIAAHTRWQPGRIEKAVQRAVGAVQRRRVSVLTALGIVCVVLMLPMPHRIKTDCVLEPVSRRYVAVPFDATLEEVFVEPGDRVVEGQLLARLEGSEVSLERDEVAAAIEKLSRERDGYLAAHEFGKAALASHEINGLLSQRELLTQRFQTLEIVAPTDGLVVNGDLDGMVGTPLETGDTLFEIAPLAAMSVELEVPDDEVGHVQVGMPVTLWLNAAAGSRTTKIERIHPRAQLRDQQNVFIAEATLPESAARLQPGMEGTARIRAGRRPVAWLLFHRPWQKFRAMVGW